MTKISFVNDHFINHENALVHIEDRGYQFSDGIYEVILIKNSKFIDWQLHYDRLVRSAREIKLGNIIDQIRLERLIKELLMRNNLNDGVIYIQMSRGVAKRDHAFPKDPTKLSLILTVNKPDFLSGDIYDAGVEVITTPDIRWKRRDIKTISLLPNILAKQEASIKKAVEAIFIEDDGYITEGSSTNFFIFDEQDILRTPTVNNRILNGITRRQIVKIARESGMNCKEEQFTLNDVIKSKAAFMCSTTKHILPVRKINQHNIEGGISYKPLADIRKLYNDYIIAQTA